jgi:hypothetical protein
VEVEGKLGQGKRCCGLDRVATNLKETKESTIAIAALMENLQRESFGFVLYLPALATFFLFDADDERSVPTPA